MELIDSFLFLSPNAFFENLNSNSRLELQVYTMPMDGLMDVRPSVRPSIRNALFSVGGQKMTIDLFRVFELCLRDTEFSSIFCFWARFEPRTLCRN